MGSSGHSSKDLSGKRAWHSGNGYLSNNDTLLSEDGIKTLNAYALKGYRLITDYPLFDKPTSREEFLDAFNVAMQFYEKKDS